MFTCSRTFIMSMLIFTRNGVSRAGVFCAVSMCVDKLRAEGEVDVFNAVRTVMRNRPQLVENLVSISVGNLYP